MFSLKHVKQTIGLIAFLFENVKKPLILHHCRSHCIKQYINVKNKWPVRAWRTDRRDHLSEISLGLDSPRAGSGWAGGWLAGTGGGNLNKQTGK